MTAPYRTTIPEEQIRACAVERLHAHNPLALPDCKAFTEIFASATVIPDLHKYKNRGPLAVWRIASDGTPRRTLDSDRYTGDHVKRCELSSFCSVSRGNCMEVTTHPAIVELIERRMLIVDRMTLNFQIVLRGTGTALVTCDYSLISGGLWLAIIPQADLPEGVLR